jgi:hypothetical protein
MKKLIALSLIAVLAACQTPEYRGGEEPQDTCAPGARLCAD